MKQKSNLLFADKSQKLFTKIEFVNALTHKEISMLNSKYMTLGLYIKQVVVDNFGNEINEEKSEHKDLLGKKRNRKDFNSLNDFLNKYYREDEFLSINKHPKKYKKNISSENESNKKFTKEEFSKLVDSLDAIKEDCKKIEYRNCIIETDEFKSKIIDYILKFQKYVSKEQYSLLFNKWKNELSKIKGVDLFDFNSNNNLLNWKVSILKSFKSELILYGICNLFKNSLDRKDINNENKSDKNNENSKEIYQDDKKGSCDSDFESSENENDENFFNKNEGLFLKDNNEDDF